jgi:Predicted nucleic-acid-binding protein, contains PIN domain
MVVLIDTNILLDVLEKRRGFYGMSLEILTWCATGRIKGVIALHSVSNIFFILRKQCPAPERRRLLSGILDFLQVAGLSHADVKNALLREDFSDFEDCLQDESAKKAGADYIITRNIQDFKHAAVKAVAPEEFMKLLSVR